MLYQVFKKKQERKDCLVSQPPGEASFPLLVLHNLMRKKSRQLKKGRNLIKVPQQGL